LGAFLVRRILRKTGKLLMSGTVSAIIPTYNYGHFVGRAIDSVLNQTYPAIECVVVNDGSTDNTLQVLSAYRGRIRVIDKPNEGLSAARNSGIAAAKGDYIALLDSDDWWDPEKIGQQMRLLEARPELKAVGCGVRVISKDLTPVQTLAWPAPTRNLEENLRAVATRRTWIGGSGSGLLARREVFEEIGLFDTRLKAAEDWDMWLRIAAKYPFANVDEVLTNLYAHGTGSFRNAAKMEENQWRVYEKAVQQWPKALDQTVQRQMRAIILADAGGEYLGAGDTRMARRRYAESVRAWPRARQRWVTLMKLTVKQMGLVPRPAAAVLLGILANFG
jgi:cellulose synthase/poly-beta-1,6-N-acetylglucosamine synthase-like glycosyltransferase